MQTGLSHACANGFTPAVEALSEVPEVDVNQPDNEGNSPLIFAAQAGMANSEINFHVLPFGVTFDRHSVIYFSDRQLIL